MIETLMAELDRDRGPLRALRERAASDPRTVLLPEADDPRVRTAAAVLLETGLARPLLVGRRPHSAGDEALRRLDSGLWLDPEDEVRRRRTAELIRRRRIHRGMTQGQAHVHAAEALFSALAGVDRGEADAVVAGAVTSTAAVVRAALWTVGTAAGSHTVSGAFLMLPPRPELRPLMMADCAAVPEPTEDQLLEIAMDTAATYERLLARRPAVAMLSFSTRGSSAHPAAGKVASVAQRLSAARPDLTVAGEVQVDAALVPAVAATKGIDWGASGGADVLIFPDLGSGNIGHKLVERLGGWRAVGPILQGTRRPVCDLSRGCSALDVVDAAVVVGLQAAARMQGG